MLDKKKSRMASNREQYKCILDDHGDDDDDDALYK